MDIREQYLDTESVNSYRSSLRTNRTQSGFNVIARAPPTLSINLDNTVVQTIVPPIDNNIDNERGTNVLYDLPRLRSMHSLSSFVSRKRTKPLNNSDQISITTSIDPIIESASTYDNMPDTANNLYDSNDNSIGFDDDVKKDLMDRLTKSIYQSPNSLADYPYGSKPVVSNEIPDVFISKAVSASNTTNVKSYDKNFLILTSAGKPIFAMFGKDNEMIPYMGIINTIINYFQVHESVNVKTITLKKTRQKFTFMNKSPILLMAYSKNGETTNELMTQLDLIYSYLISSINERQLKRLFHNRSNFDLHNFLEVTDFENLEQLGSLLCNKLYPDFNFNALQCFIMRKSIRTKIHDTIYTELLNENKFIPRGTLLYGLILSRKRHMFKLCSVIRPRGHTLHTIDLQLLFCLIRHQFENREGNQELWLPICFPKFNSNGFLYSYIKYLSRYNAEEETEDTALVLISAQKDAFFKLKLFGDKLWEKLQNNGLSKFLIRDHMKFRMSDIPAPLIHHFIYKAKKYVQYVMPELEIHNSDDNDLVKYERKLKNYYGHLYHLVVDEKGIPINKTMLNYIHWEESDIDTEEGDFQREKINMMGLVWITPQFELYLICNNSVDDKDVILSSARRIISWCKKHEPRLFIQEGAMF